MNFGIVLIFQTELERVFGFPTHLKPRHKEKAATISGQILECIISEMDFSTIQSLFYFIFILFIYLFIFVFLF
jgi:hypothetical protein